MPVTLDQVPQIEAPDQLLKQIRDFAGGQAALRARGWYHGPFRDFRLSRTASGMTDLYRGSP